MTLIYSGTRHHILHALADDALLQRMQVRGQRGAEDELRQRARLLQRPVPHALHGITRICGSSRRLTVPMVMRSSAACEEPPTRRATMSDRLCLTSHIRRWLSMDGTVIYT